MFLLCLKGGQKGRRYFSFPISAHRVACSVTPGSLTLSLAHLFYRMVFGDSNIHESPAAHVQSSRWCVETCPRSGAEHQRVLSHAIDAGQSRTESRSAALRACSSQSARCAKAWPQSRIDQLCQLTSTDVLTISRCFDSQLMC